MSTSPTPVLFAEQNEFALLLARGAANGRSLRLESLVEIPHTNASALADAVRRSLPAGAAIVCAVRPAIRSLHLASAADAGAHAGAAGAVKFAQSLPEFAGAGPIWASAVRARDGAVADNSPWLLAAAPTESHEQSIAALSNLGLSSPRAFSASHHAVGAIVSLASTPTLLVDIGEHQAHALVLGPSGVIAVAPVSLSLDAIAEAVQAELGMKFRGSAVKLFFNPDYDFTDTAAKITARLAASLKPELAAMPGAKPGALACSGLPAAQQWLTQSLAAELGLTPFAPDLKAWCQSAGTTFASTELEASLSPAWAGFLRLVNTGAGESTAPWHTAWQSASSASAAPASAPAVVVAAPAPVAKAPPPPPPAPPAPVAKTPPPPPATAVAPAPAAAPAPAKPTPTPIPSPVISVKTVPAQKPAAPAPAQPAQKPVPVQQPAAPVPVAKVAAPTAVAPAKAAVALAPSPAPKTTVPDSAVTYPLKAGQPANKGSAKKQPEPAPAKSVVAAAASKAATPPPANKTPAKPAATPAPAPAQPRSKKPLLLGLGLAALIAVSIGGVLFWQAKREEAARVAAEQARVEAERVAEAERKRKIEEQARIEAETRRKIEIENAQKVAAQEAARQQAENEARIANALRLANARGSIVVGGPAGATVKIGDLPARTAPATFTDLKLGRHAVTISLPHHETVTLELQVKENEKTDAGPVKLTRLVGTLILTSEPGDANYEIRPANTISLYPGAVRKGRTPVTFDDIAPGDYVVTFTREGWQPHTETVSVGRDSTVRAACAFRTGIVKLTTTPAGAAVMHDGKPLGVTPLTLVEQNPGEVTYELTLAGFDPAIVETRIQSGQVVAIDRKLEAEDRLTRLNDTDQRPVAILTPQPDVSSQRITEPLRVDVSLTVDRHGNPRDIQVAKAPSAEVGKLCAEAAAKWKFKPATVAGQPVNVRVSVPFNILPPPR